MILGLHGRHQAGNALLALRVVETLAQRDHWHPRFPWVLALKQDKDVQGFSP